MNTIRKRRIKLLDKWQTPMIISHRKKFAFFANQKTGSKAVGLMLRLSGIFDENDIMVQQPFLATRTAEISLPGYNLGEYSSIAVTHMTPASAIEAGFITLEQLREYDCYAFLRDAEERFIAVRANLQMNRYGKLLPMNRPMPFAPPPQYKFFYVGDEQVVTPLDFNNYENEIRMLLDKLGGYKQTDVAQVTQLYRTKMPVMPVKFEPRHHMKDIIMYRNLINKSNK